VIIFREFYPVKRKFMSKDRRISLIKSIQTARDNSLVICYITSIRPGLDVKMSIDVIRKIYDHLINIPAEERKKKNVDLFICSNGGDGTVPWKLVTLIREFAAKFSVIVPFRAFSAATLTALGADEIVMHPMGMLGPTDATVANQYNPDDPRNPLQKLGISGEDVTSFISLIKDDVGITHEDELVQAFNKLSDQIHPLALGNVKRSISQSSMMAKKLLNLHMQKEHTHKINDIAENLTSKLYFHGHPINRDEAKDIGLGNVITPNATLERLIWDLYLEYESEMNLTAPFNPVAELIKVRNPTYTHPAAPPMPGVMLPNPYVSHTGESKIIFLESEFITDTTVMKYEITGAKTQVGQYQTNLVVLDQDWSREETPPPVAPPAIQQNMAETVSEPSTNGTS
jgi:Serine dehydrogenase proteinase